MLAHEMAAMVASLSTSRDTTPVGFVMPLMTRPDLFNADDSATSPHRFCLVDDLLGAPAR